LAQAAPGSTSARLPSTTINTVGNFAADTTNVQQASATAAPQNMPQQSLGGQPLAPITPQQLAPVAVPAAASPMVPDVAQPALSNIAPAVVPVPADTASGSLAVKDAAASSTIDTSDGSSVKGRRNPIRRSGDSVSTTSRNPLR
jgi:hypothetical protein